MFLQILSIRSLLKKYLLDYKFLSLILLLFPYNLICQQSSIIFSKANLSVFNPAFTGLDGPSLILNSRLQWIGIDDAPRTNYFLYHLPAKKNVHLGISALNERVFIENKTYLNVDYNYKLQLNEERSIYLAIKAGGFYNNIDTDRIPRIFNEANPLLSAVESYFNPMVGVGFTVMDPKFFIGLGTPNLFNSKRFQNNGDLEPSAQDLTLFHLTGGYTFSINDKLNLNPLIIYRALSDLPNFVSGNVSLVYQEKISVGTGLSNNDNISVFFISKNKYGFQWGYGYEFLRGSSEIAINKPTHEIFIRLSIEKKEIPEEQETSTDNEE